MMVARWSIDAKFGYKQDVVEAMKRWLRDIAPQVGIDAGAHPAADRLGRGAGSDGPVGARHRRPGRAQPRMGQAGHAFPRTSNGARIWSRTWSRAPAAGKSTAFSEEAGRRRRRGYYFGAAAWPRQREIADALHVVDPRAGRPAPDPHAGRRPGGLRAHAALRRPSLKARGVLRAVESLSSQDDAPRASRSARAARRCVDGPFAEAKEMVGGFFLLDCATREEALAIARECPAAEWATVEVRAVGPCYT